jgi:hypothetical protein
MTTRTEWVAITASTRIRYSTLSKQDCTNVLIYPVQLSGLWAMHFHALP